MKKKIYIVSVFKIDDAKYRELQTTYVNLIVGMLKSNKFDVYLPKLLTQEDDVLSNYREDVKAIKNCDVMVILADDAQLDIGSAIEVGMGYMLDKPTIRLISLRRHEEEKPLPIISEFLSNCVDVDDEHMLIEELYK
jgi:nucleoside 2-deoxyribosyltransferase